MMYVKADDESILPYGEEVQRRHTAFMPLDFSTVVLGRIRKTNNCNRVIFIVSEPYMFILNEIYTLRNITMCEI